MFVVNKHFMSLIKNHKLKTMFNIFKTHLKLKIKYIYSNYKKHLR